MLKTKYGPWALIVGGSEGIGAEFATQLAAQGYSVALIARRQATLDATAKAARTAGAPDVRTLIQDLTAPDMMERIAAFTKDLDVGLVIYNAGALDRITTFLGDNIEGHLHTIRLNCDGPTRICHHFGQRMKARGNGCIVLMSALAALAGTYGVPVYSATKSFDSVLAEGLWAEFREFGISVLSAVIGAVNTPSHERLLHEDRPNAPYPKEIAEEILANLDNGPVVYVKSIAQAVPIMRDADRAKAVSMMADAAKAFASPNMNRKPFDPAAVVR